MIDNIPKNPFINFSSEKADKIFDFAEAVCVDEIDAAAHFAACLMALCPSRDIAETLLKFVDVEGAIKEAQKNESPRH